MKIFVLFGTLFLSRFVFAESYPESIVCTSEGVSKVVREFELTKLDTINPGSTFPKAKLSESPDLYNDTYEVVFTNGLENLYLFKLFSRDLFNLKAKYSKIISGTLDYFDEESKDKTGESIRVVCRLK